jgi:TolA-binding protein
MKKIILFLFTFLISISAQQLNDKYAQALNAYSNHEYGTAYQILKEVFAEGTLNEKELSSAKYYSAECLLQLDELDGAASEFESFIDKFKFSSFRETALYKLGSLYYTKGEYRKARERLNILLAEYHYSSFKGSSYYWLGESYLAEEKYVDAEENFNEAIKQEKTNKFFVNSLYSLAQVYERTNDYKKAIAEYDELLAYYKDDPLAPKSQLRIGICYFNHKDYDNAILELTDPLMKKLPVKELNDAKYFLANSYVRLKEYKEASQVYKELLNETQDEPYIEKIKYSLAWLNFQQNDYENAYKIFSELSSHSSDSLKAISLYWSGECKRYLGSTKEAAEIFKSFIEKYPTHGFVSRAQLNIGAVNLNQTNSGEGEKALLNATMSEDLSTRGKAYTFLGELRLNKKNYEDAKKYFSQAVKLTSGDKELNNRSVFGLAVADFYLNDYSNTALNLESLKARTKNFETDKVNFYLAEAYFLRGKYSAALKSYNSVSNSSEDLARQILLGKAYSYFNLKDFSNSTFYFNEYINKYGNDPSINEIRLRLADSYFGTKNFTKASSIYRDLFSKEKFLLNNDAAYYQYGQSLFKSGKSKEAINAFENLQEKFPRSQYVAESQYVIGWIYFQENNFSSAMASYKKMVEKYPNSNLKPVAYYSIGDCYFNSGSYDSSIVFYNKVLSEFPASQYVFDAVNGIQYAYIAKQEPERAVDFIDQFIAANPNSKFSDQIFFKKGDLYYSIKKYDDAIRAYNEFITQYSKSNLVPNAFYWIGKSAANKKDNNEAINNFTIAKQRAPKSEIGISSTIELANIYTASKQYSGASNILKEMIYAVPTSNRIPELLFLQGVNQVKDNQLDAAASAFDQIISYYEGSIFSAKAKVELGKIQLQKNNYDNAQVLLKEVGEKRLDDIGAEAQYYYGVLLYNQNKIDDAITALVRVRSVFAVYDEWNTRSLLMLGDCYLKMNDKKQAREMYRTVLSRHPNGEFSVEAKKKIKQL